MRYEDCKYGQPVQWIGCDYYFFGCEDHDKMGIIDKIGSRWVRVWCGDGSRRWVHPKKLELRRI